MEELRGNRGIAVDFFEKITLTDAYNNDQKKYFDIFGAAEEKLADYYFDNNNRKLSSAFVERAAKHGNLDAMFGIAVNSFYKNKLYDISIKPKEGFDIIKRLADEFNDKNACGFLASAYFAGFIPSKNDLLIDGKEFLSQDYQKCVFYAEKYIINKDVCRLHWDMDVKAMLGHCYIYGLGVKQNLNKAEEYLNEALSYDENNLLVVKAMIWLYIKRGETNPSDQNKEKCIYWLRKAADLGDEDAKNGLKSMQSSNGCYIATCIYGSYDCPQVWVLRRFRDFFLRRFTLGEFFIKYYYRISPMIVDIFGECYLFRFVFRKFLDFMVLWLKNRGYSDKLYND